MRSRLLTQIAFMLTLFFGAVLTCSAAADNRYCNFGNVVNFAGVKTDGPANLPTSCFFTALSATPSTGKVTAVPAGAKLQSYINSAVCGETLMLEAGASYKGNELTFPAKHCDDNHWITMRTNTPNSGLPAEGIRMTPCWAKVTSLPGRPAFPCPAGGVPSGRGRRTRRGIAAAGRPVGGGVVYVLARTTGGSKIIFDRTWMHGTAKDDSTRAVQLNNAHNVAVIDSYLNDFHCVALTGSCSDAQAIMGGIDSTSAETFKIVNNFLEASGENILLGGGTSLDTPGDWEIRRNHFYKPMTWNPADPSFIGTKFAVKNHFEMKNGTRVLLEGNIMENVWGGFSQVGTHILLTPKSQVSGTQNLCPNCFVTHVTIRYNHMISGGQGLQIANLANDNGVYATAGNSDSIHDNLFENLAYATCYMCQKYYNQISTGQGAPSTDILKNVTLQHNTFVVATAAEGTVRNAGMLLLGGPPTPLQPNIHIYDNIFVAGYYGPWSAGSTTNCATNQGSPLQRFNACWLSPYKFLGNLIPGGMSIHQTASWPSGDPYPNRYPQNQAGVGYVNLKNGFLGDYHLSSSSPYKRTASDGTDPGPNIDALNSYTQGVN